MSPKTVVLSFLLLVFAPACKYFVNKDLQVNTDICILGGSQAGFTGALQAARMGKTVALIEPTGHPGGMMVEGILRDIRFGSARIREAGGVKKEGTDIESIRLDYGMEIFAEVFIDASIEGYLLHFAGIITETVRGGNAAYGAISILPTFMILGQGAGCAASLAMDGDENVQEMDYQVLRMALLENGQIHEMSGNWLEIITTNN